MRRGLVVSLLIASLLVQASGQPLPEAPASTGWMMTNGDAARTGQAPFPGELLDVAAVITVFDGCKDQAMSVTGGVMFAYGEHGLTWVASPMDDNCLPTDRPCSISLMRDWRNPVMENVTADPCGGSLFTSMFEDGGRTYGLISGASARAPAGLGAFDVEGDGTPRWFISVYDAFSWGKPLPAVDPQEAVYGQGADAGRPAMICWDTAVVPEERAIYAACYASFQGQDAFTNRLIKIDFDGVIEWSRSMPPLSGWGTPHQSGTTVADPLFGANTYMALIGVAVSDNGIFANAYSYCFDPRCEIPAYQEPSAGHYLPSEGRAFSGVLVWTDKDGRYVGSHSTFLETTQANPTQVQSPRWGRLPVAAGDVGAIVLGNEIVYVDVNSPSAPPARQMPAGESPLQGSLSVPGGVTDGRRIYASGYQAVVAIDSTTTEFAWEAQVLAAGPGWWKPAVMVDPVASKLLAIFHESTGSVRHLDAGEQWMDSALAVLADADTGRTIQRLPIPLTDVMHTHAYVMPSPDNGDLSDQGIVDWDVGVKNILLGDGHVALSTGMGTFVILGPQRGDGMPLVAPDDAYPPEDEPTRFSFAEPFAPESLHVVWGDGSWDTFEPDQPVVHLSNTYTTTGTFDVVITAEWADGRTSTRATTVHVGGSPPANLNFLQTAFAPENQDLTFGVLGIGVAVLGAMIGVLLRWRRRGHIRAGLRDIEEARRIGHEDPVGGIAAAARLNRLFNERLVGGRYTEDQHRVLTGRATALMHKLARVHLAKALYGTTKAFQELVWGVLGDDIVTEAEADSVEQAAMAERRLAGGHGAVMDVLAAWRG